MGFKLFGRNNQKKESVKPAAQESAAEKDLSIEMVDFYAEADYIIGLGLAESKRDVNTINWYRIVDKNQSAFHRKEVLVLENARIVCDGKMYGLCEGIVHLENSLMPSADGHLRLQMKGPLDALSKCQAACSCGTRFLLTADATVGKANECYLRIETVEKAEKAQFSIRPFFEIDGVAVHMA